MTHLDYLVGGLRISLDPEHGSPGPRTHITGFIDGLRTQGLTVRLFLASEVPLLSRVARGPNAAPPQRGPLRLLVSDLLRIGAAAWCGLHLFARTLHAPVPEVIYERIAVMQSLTSFHTHKRRAIRVVEANGVMHRETAHDRDALLLTGLARAVERHVLRTADLVVAVSDALADELVSFARIPRERILVLPNGVDLALTELPLPDEAPEFDIGFVGSFSRWQRLDRLIDAIEEQAHPVRAEIVGDGQVRKELECDVRRRGLESRVTLSGSLPPGRAHAHMLRWQTGFAGHERSSSDTMYHSPLKLYEYAALGLDVVATESADARALADSGIRFAFFDDSRALGDAVRKALSFPPRSPAERAQIRAQIGREHGWHVRAAQLIQRCDRLLAERNAER